MAQPKNIEKNMYLHRVLDVSCIELSPFRLRILENVEYIVPIVTTPINMSIKPYIVNSYLGQPSPQIAPLYFPTRLFPPGPAPL